MALIKCILVRWSDMYTYSTDIDQRLTLESWFFNLEQTPLNRSQQLPAPHRQLIDGLKKN